MSARYVVGRGWQIDGVDGFCAGRTRADMARAEGIALVAFGPKTPLFARDAARWIELGAIDTRTAEEIASDAEYDRQQQLAITSRYC